MESLFALDWKTLFVPSGSLVEIVVRGTLMYLGLFTLLRVILKRQSGGLSITDVLVTVLIADAAQNGMAGEYKSIPEGLLLVATITFWSYALDWLEYRFGWFHRLIEPSPLLLFDGRELMRKNMRRELVTQDEIETAIREKGYSGLGQVEKVFIEPDGRLSVVPKPPENH